MLHSVQRNEDCTGWDLTPRGEKNQTKTRAGGYFQQQNATIEWKRDQRQDPTLQLSGWNTSQRRRRRSCSWDVKEDDVETCQKGAETGSQHRVTQLLFSCQTTNTNRQLGFWLAWIQIETKTQWEHTPWKHAWKTVELDWIYSIFQLFVFWWLTCET